MNIVIMSCPPRDPDYVRNQLISDGVSYPHTVIDNEHRGNLYCAIEAFSLGTKFAGPLTIVQDDIEICRGFVPYLEKYMGEVERNNLVLQWFASPHYFPTKDNVTGPDGFRRGADDFLFCLATTYSRKWAFQILDYLSRIAEEAEETGKWKDDTGRVHGDDMHIRDLLKREHGEYWVHVPGIVQHVGERSLVGNADVPLLGERVSRCYVGKEFDARGLEVSKPWLKQR